MLRIRLGKRKRENAQGIVEFALILPILLLVVLGIVEFGRLLFFYSSVTSASREGARYGAAVGEVSAGLDRYEDCVGIRDAARRAGTFARLEDSDITIQYDDGASLKDAVCPPTASIGLADRVVVTVVGNFQPITPIIDVFFPDDGLDITSTTARTIIKEVGVKGTPVPTDPPPGQPFLTVSKTDNLVDDVDGNGFPSPGDTLRYTIVVANIGSEDATGLIFTDSPDGNTSLVVGSVATGQGSITGGNGSGDTSVAVNVGTIASSGSVTISFDVLINSGLPITVTEVSNQGVVSSNELADALTDDPAVGGDSDPTVTLLTYFLELQASKVGTLQDDADGNGVASPGDTLRYTIVVFNSGTGQLTGVEFNDSPDGNTTLVVGSVQTTDGTVTSGNGSGDSSVTVDIGDMLAGATVGITFDVTINEPLPLSVTEVSNQGIVSSGELSDVLTDDPDVGGDEDPTVITILVIHTPTPTSTSTAGPTPTPSPTPTPTNTPVPICGLEFRNFQQPSDRKITWDLFNNPSPGVLPITVLGFQLNFPESKLNQIDFGGITIWDGPPAAAPFITLNVADWKGTASDRYLGVGEEKTFTLYFNNDVSASGYTIRIFTDNCVDPVSASH